MHRSMYSGVIDVKNTRVQGIYLKPSGVKKNAYSVTVTVTETVTVFVLNIDHENSKQKQHRYLPLPGCPSKKDVLMHESLRHNNDLFLRTGPENDVTLKSICIYLIGLG